MPFSSKPKWMIEHPAWPWVVFALNTFLVFVAAGSTFSLVFQQQNLTKEINRIDVMLVDALRINQSNINVVAKEAGVPPNKIVQPKIPVVPKVE